MSSPKHILCPETLNTLRLIHVVRHYGKKVLQFVMDKSLLDGETRTIHEILQANGATFGKKGYFNDQDNQNLLNKAPNDFDITLLNKICRFIWDKRLHDPGQLKDKIKVIKDTRNNVSHEEEKVSKEELQIRLHDFQTLVEEILGVALSVFPSHCDEICELNKEIQDESSKVVEKIREKYDLEDVQKFHEEIDDFGDLLHGHILDKVIDELSSFYEVFCKIRLSDWLPQCEATDPNNVMISLKLDEQKTFCFGGGKSDTVNQNDILEIKNTKGEDPKAIVVSGNAGTGKTTILCSIAQKWRKGASDMAGLSSFETLMYIQFRDETYENVDDFLQHRLHRTVSRFSLKHVKASIQNSTCLFLCDGFDERNVESEKLFKEMLEFSHSCKGVKIVVTTRPGNTDKLTQIVNGKNISRINLSILGLTQNDMQNLIGNVCRWLMRLDDTQRQKTEKALHKAMEEMDEKALDILRTPLYFNLFIMLYTECEDFREKITSVTALFRHLEEHKRQRLIKNSGLWPETLKCIEKVYEHHSIDSYITKKYEFSEEDIENFRSKLKKETKGSGDENAKHLLDKFDSVISVYFNIKYELKGLEIKKIFCLRHRSEQEFVVAKVVCEDIINSGRRQRRNIVQRVLSAINIQRMIPSGRKQRKNVVESILSSNGIHRHILDITVVAFITGLLHHSNRAVFEQTVDDLFQLSSTFMSADEDGDYVIDPLLTVYAEVNNDQKALESLVSLMGQKIGNSAIVIREASSLKQLSSLLPRLESQILYIHIYEALGKKNLESLVNGLMSMPKNGGWDVTNVFINTTTSALSIFKDFTASRGQDVITLCKLFFCIEDDGGSINDLPSFPVTGETLVVLYEPGERESEEWPSVVNSVWPTSRDSLSCLIIWVNQCTQGDIRTFLQSLTVQPLRSVIIVTATEEVKNDLLVHILSLQNISQDRHLGKLIIITQKEWGEFNIADLI